MGVAAWQSPGLFRWLYQQVVTWQVTGILFNCVFGSCLVVWLSTAAAKTNGSWRSVIIKRVGTCATVSEIIGEVFYLENLYKPPGRLPGPPPLPDPGPLTTDLPFCLDSCAIQPARLDFWRHYAV